MKNKILWALIGFLLGALVSTAGFYFYGQSVKTDAIPQQMQGGQTPPDKPDGNNGQTPPEMPDGQTLPDKPEEPAQ